MKVWKFILVISALSLMLTSIASSEEYVGGMGTMWVGSAMTLPPGAADIGIHGQVWAGKVGNLSGIKTGSSALNIHFGYSRNFEIGMSQITYMDPNWGSRSYNLNGQIGKTNDNYIIPGDLTLRFKYGSLATTMGQLYVLHSFQLGIRYRVAKYNNLPLYPYFGGGNAPSLTWNMSWYQRPLYPEESEFIGVSATYTNHNDQNGFGESAQSIQWGAAYMHPMQNMSVGLQFHGMAFIHMPRKEVFSREPFAYISPVVNFQLFSGMEMMLSPEILLGQAKNTTSGVFEPKDTYNYEPWRFSGLLRFRPSTTFYSSDPFAKVGEGRRGAGAAALRERLARQSRESLFDWTVDSERDLQFLNLDLEKTRIERQKAEEELLKLKQEVGK